MENIDSCSDSELELVEELLKVCDEFFKVKMCSPKMVLASLCFLYVFFANKTDISLKDFERSLRVLHKNHKENIRKRNTKK